MKKILSFALLVLAASGALAQSYPSPTFNNITVQGTLTAATPAFTNPVPVASGGTNCSAASGTCLDNITGFASTGFLTRTGAGTYAFQPLTNGITYGNLAQAGANTLLGNATGSTANVSAITVTGCNGAAQALQWTSGSGFGCNSNLATSGANANITSLSGLTTPLSVAQGGTGGASLAQHQILAGSGTGAITTVGAGSSGQVLTSNGSSAYPTFQAIPWGAPQAIGSVTPNSGAFTTLSGTITPETEKLETNQGITMFPGQNTDYSDYTITHTNSGSHSGTSNSAFSIASTVTGSGANGPLNADYGMYISKIKDNYLTSSTLGEIDGLSIVTRQGQDDTDGILVNAGGVAGFMGILEGVTSQFQATTGTVLKQMDVQLGSIETGLTGTAGSEGIIATANTGTMDAGLLIQSIGSAGWTNAIDVHANSGGASTFTVTPAGVASAKSVATTSAPTSSWGFDATGSTASIANGGNAVMAAGNGLIMVEESISSQSAIYLCSDGTCGMVANNGGSIWVSSTTTPSAGHMSVMYNGSSGYAIYNNEGATETVTVGSIRMKAGN